MGGFGLVMTLRGVGTVEPPDVDCPIKHACDDGDVAIEGTISEATAIFRKLFLQKLIEAQILATLLLAIVQVQL
jgi:hypothetical protein